MGRGRKRQMRKGKGGEGEGKEGRSLPYRQKIVPVPLLSTTGHFWGHDKNGSANFQMSYVILGTVHSRSKY